MIRVRKGNQTIKIIGHAGYDRHGKDIVCAAVSVLFQTLIKSMETLSDDEITYYIEEGSAKLKYEYQTKTTKTLLESFWLGLGLLVKEYSDYVSIEDERSA